MTKGKAVILAVFTAWPFLYMILFMATIFTTMMSGFSGRLPVSGPPMIFKIIFPLHLLTMLEIFLLLVVYFIYLFNTNRVPQDKKTLWAVVLFLGNMFVMPVFWYLYIWKETETQTPEQVAGHDS